MSDEQKENRIKVEDLPQAEQELTPEEAKEVQGGQSSPGVGILRSLDGGKTWDATTQSTDDIITGAGSGGGPHVK
jgi:hypothetical protein